MIVNRTELLVELPKQTDMSLYSRLEANPLVQDVEEELKRLDEEKKKEVDSLGGTLGFDEVE
jgi:hypothetical protein